jgi:hypothetical protein
MFYLWNVAGKPLNLLIFTTEFLKSGDGDPYPSLRRLRQEVANGVRVVRKNLSRRKWVLAYREDNGEEMRILNSGHLAYALQRWLGEKSELTLEIVLLDDDKIEELSMSGRRARVEARRN